MLQSLQFLEKIQPFFLKKHSPDCRKLLINFQSSGKVDTDNFARILVTFMENTSALSDVLVVSIFADLNTGPLSTVIVIVFYVHRN